MHVRSKVIHGANLNKALAQPFPLGNLDIPSNRLAKPLDDAELNKHDLCA